MPKLKRSIKRLTKTNSIRVSQTWDETTPESAENGEFSDTGFTVKPYQTRSLQDIVSMIENLGGHDSCVDVSRDGKTVHISLYELDGDTDYHTNTETRQALHLSGPVKLLKPIIKRYKRKHYEAPKRAELESIQGGNEFISRKSRAVLTLVS